jgi:cytochrome c oxidase subunit 2
MFGELLMKIRNLVAAITVCLVVTAPRFDRAIAAQAAPKHIDVIAKRFTYEPSTVTLKKGEPTVITLKSADVAHGIHFKELNLQTKISKGGSSDLAFTPDKTGDFVGHCSVFCGSGHGGMTLTFHVVE